MIFASHLFQSLTRHSLSQHAKSKDPLDDPNIDPHVFENDFGSSISQTANFSYSKYVGYVTDLENLVQQVKLLKELHQMEPFKSLVLTELEPGPECTTDEQIRGM